MKNIKKYWKLFRLWLCANASIETQFLDRHETRLNFIIENLLKNKDTILQSRVSTHLHNELLDWVVVISPTGSRNDAIVRHNGVTSHTYITDFALRKFTKMVIDEDKIRLSKVTDFRNNNEKKKLKEMTDSFHGEIRKLNTLNG